MAELLKNMRFGAAPAVLKSEGANPLLPATSCMTGYLEDVAIAYGYDRSRTSAEDLHGGKTPPVQVYAALAREYSVVLVISSNAVYPDK